MSAESPHKIDLRDAIEHPSHYGVRQWSGWILAPLCLIATLLLSPPEGLSVEGWKTAGVAAFMAILWITESIPIPATALSALVLFPALHLGDITESAAPFAHPIIFLFMGGFFVATAMQRWNLHKRIAINLIGFIGVNPPRIVAGFLLSSALISMWVSNSATTLMMYPIALSVVALIPQNQQHSHTSRNLAVALLLAVAYGSTAGGMGTLIGTPPNAVLAAFAAKTYGYEIGFGQWMLLGTPLTLLSLPVIFFVLTRVCFKLERGNLPGMRELIAAERSTMGRFSRPELGVAVVFGLTALCWIFQPLLSKSLPMLSDTVIAMTGALVLFLIPSGTKRGSFLLDWESARNIPWDVLLLVGGGLSLAANIQKHGLAIYLGELCQKMEGLHVLLVLAVVCFGILMLTELMSNTAVAATFMPIAASIALGLGENPLLFIIPCALAANCSFMLPVGTPPNAIVFASGKITLPQMARAGMWLNVIFVPLILGAILLLGKWVFDIDLGVSPAWAK